MITAIVMISAATDSIPEVAQAIADLDGVSEVYSVAGHVDLRTPWRSLLEADLAAGHDLAVDRVPAYAAVGVHLGRLRVELYALTERALDPPVTGVLGGHLDLFDVGHKVRKVLEVGPVTEDVVDRSFHFDAIVYSLCHKRPFFWLRYLSRP